MLLEIFRVAQGSNDSELAGAVGIRQDLSQQRLRCLDFTPDLNNNIDVNRTASYIQFVGAELHNIENGRIIEKTRLESIRSSEKLSIKLD